MSPLLTVVIPVYNRAAIVERTLASVAAQSLRPLDIVLVDNASRDDTLAILHRWAATTDPALHVTILQEPRRGAPATRNRGLEAVRTPWVLFFDSDDTMRPHHLADIAHTIQRHPDADIVGRPVEMHLLNGTTRRGRYTTAHPLYNHIFHATLATQRYAVRTALLRRVGAWDTRLAGWNDWELGIRLLLQHPRMVRVAPTPAVDVYSQPHSITGTRFSHSPHKWEDALAIARRAVTHAGRADLLPLLDAKAAILAGQYRREGARTDARRLLRTLPHTRTHLIYHWKRLLGRGAPLLARLLYPGRG